MTSTILFLLALMSLWATFVSLVRVRHPQFLSFPIMMTGWLTGEYPLFHLVAQALVALVLVVLGALGEPLGWIGLAVYAVSWAGLAYGRRVLDQARPTGQAALEEGLGAGFLDTLDPRRRTQLRASFEPGLTRHPLRFDATGVRVLSDIAYGEHPKRNLLDIYVPETVAEPLPVVLQVHGGAWITGHKVQQAQPLLHRLARSGYIGVSINYRLGPKSRFPDQIIDVKRAIAWVRDNIADHGGDPATIVITGGSAGGHLSSLAALTPGEPSWQPGFEDADTSVAACIPFYGPPDFRDRHGIRGRLASLEPFLSRLVMPQKLKHDPDLWDMVSPITHVGPHAPPFFVIQGENDVLVWREEARAFVDELRAASKEPVVYWEVPRAQHAFDTFNSHRSAVAVDMVEQFLGWVVGHSAAHSTERPARPDTHEVSEQ